MPTEPAVEQLEEYLEACWAIDDLADEPDPDPYVLANEVEAERVLRAIARAEAEQRAREAAVKEEMARLQGWTQRERSRMERRTSYLRAILEQFARLAHERNPRTKSLPLPSGTLRLRKLPAKWLWPDDEDPDIVGAIDFARSRSLTRTTVRADGPAASAVLKLLDETEIPHTTEESLDKAGLKKILAVRDGQAVDLETGEVLPGVRVEEGALEFYIGLAEE